MRLFLTLVVTCCVIPASAQTRSTRRGSPLIDPSKPAVFISFLKVGQIEPLEAGVRGQYLWFRLTNNSRWAIWLEMSGVPKAYGEARLYYTIEDTTDRGKILVDSSCHVCSVNPVAPGRSIVFSIPTDHASRYSRLHIPYSFSWERDNESEGGSSSQHSVEFYFDKLPESALLSLPQAASNNDVHPPASKAVLQTEMNCGG